MSVLTLARFFMSRIHLPGRFVLANLLTRYFAPKGALVKGPVGNYCVQWNLQDVLQRHMFFGIYDEAEISLLKKLLKPGDVFFDIGANVGYYSLLASQLVGTRGQVHAFEPIKENINVLRETIRLNRITNIHPNQIAVGHQEGLLDLFIPKSVANSGWASIIPLGERKKITIKVVSVDDYVFKNYIKRVHLVKLDVEGAEHQVIAGGERLFLNLDAPDLIIEVNPFLLARQNLDSHALTDPLSNWGYSLYYISKNLKK